MKKVLIYGASSSIARFTAIEFAKNGANLILAGRNFEKLNAVRHDILARYKTDIEILTSDALDFENHKAFVDKSINMFGSIDVVLLAHGTLPDQALIQDSPAQIIEEFNSNAMSVISLATLYASYFENKKSGTIAVISSVAGDRGRASNYIYGTAKGAVSIFLQGLRNRLSSSNVNVLTIKPGFVDTPMTSHLPKNFLYAKPELVGEQIYDAISKQKDIVYIPKFWRLIMFMIKHIPEFIFKKLSI